MMSTVPFTQQDLENVREYAHRVALNALKQFEGHPISPLLALAALTTAACNAALVTDTTFTQLMELVTLHYHAASVGIAIQELEAEMGKKLAVGKLPVDEEPS